MYLCFVFFLRFSSAQCHLTIFQCCSFLFGLHCVCVCVRVWVCVCLENNRKKITLDQSCEVGAKKLNHNTGTLFKTNSAFPVVCSLSDRLKTEKKRPNGNTKERKPNFAYITFFVVNATFSFVLFYHFLTFPNQTRRKLILPRILFTCNFVLFLFWFAYTVAIIFTKRHKNTNWFVFFYFFLKNTQ